MAANSGSSGRRITFDNATSGFGGTARERVSRILGNGMLQRATIPRPADRDTVSRADASVPSTEHAALEGEPSSVEEELRARFPSLQRRSNRRQLTPYLPRHNYTPNTRRQPTFQRSSMIQLASRSASRRACNPIVQSNFFTRDIILVEAGEDVPVPRGKLKQELHDRGCIINMMEVDKQWNEHRLFDEIERRLPMLDMSKPFPRFRFMTACYGRLKIPNVGPNFVWTGAKVKQSCNQGCIYIQALHPLLDNPMNTDTVGDVDTSTQSQNNNDDTLSLDGTQQDETMCPPSGSGLQSVSSIPEDTDTGLRVLDNDQTVDLTRSPGHSMDLTRSPRNQTEADIETLREMFPSTPQSLIRKIQRENNGDLNVIVNVLLAQADDACSSSEKSPSEHLVPLYEEGSSSSVCCSNGAHIPSVPSYLSDVTSIPRDSPMHVILKAHAEREINFNHDITLFTSREHVWLTAKQFYKAALSNTSRLTRNLVIEFSGEEGVDVGALRSEFFETVISNISQQLFEGSDRKIPKNEWGLLKEFEMAGLIVAHSVLHGGPGVPFISPVLYSFIVTGDRENLLGELPTIDDIPQNSATADLLQLITKLDTVTNQKDIDAIIDTPEYLSLISCSGWPTTRLITTVSKTELLQGLIFEEVVHKREAQMRSFCTGLKALNFLTLVRAEPEKLRPVFVYKCSSITFEKIQSLVVSPRPNDAIRSQVYDWFMSYLKQRHSDKGHAEGRATLQDVLSFCTGHSTLPPMGLPQPIEVDYLPISEGHSLPMAAACFSLMRLPTVHKEQKAFEEMMDKGILYSVGYYGQV